jgi:hypothetical protein
MDGRARNRGARLQALREFIHDVRSFGCWPLDVGRRPQKQPV